MNLMNDERTRAWAYLSRVFEGPSRELHHLLEAGEDPERIAHAIRHRDPTYGPLLAQTQSRYLYDAEAQDLEAAQRVDARMITRDDAEWPGEILQQAFGFAASGRSEHQRSYQRDAVAPHVLWVKGLPVAHQLAQAVSVVGTRAPTQYGVTATRELVAGLVRHQWTVISGGALGIDTVAHSEAMVQGGSTVVVTACGIDYAYPRKNSALFRKVVEHGCMVSEYAPGLQPHRHRFLTRNRLVAALGRGTVVVEAAWRSGALNTLSWAEALGKVAMAVPGPITSVASLGCHQRIKHGSAQLVTSADEIRELVGQIGQVDSELQYELEFAKSPVQRLSDNELRVYDSLGAEPIVTADVAEAAGLTLPLTVHLLVDLQRCGLAHRDGSRWRRAEVEA